MIFAATKIWAPKTPQSSCTTLRNLVNFSELQRANLKNGDNKNIYLTGLLYGLNRMMLATSTLAHGKSPILAINMLSSPPTAKWLFSTFKKIVSIGVLMMLVT